MLNTRIREDVSLYMWGPDKDYAVVDFGATVPGKCAVLLDPVTGEAFTVNVGDEFVFGGNPGARVRVNRVKEKRIYITVTADDKVELYTAKRGSTIENVINEKEGKSNRHWGAARGASVL